MTTVAPLITTHADATVAAAAYADSVADGVIERDRSGKLPVKELAELDGSGLLAITVPIDDGGPELPVTTLVEVIRLIATTDSALAQALQGHFLMVDIVSGYGSEHQRAVLFDSVLNGGRLGNALAERGGQHAQDLRTELRHDAEGLRLDGRKYYCTGTLTSRWIGSTALNERRQMVLAFVRRDAPGVALDEDWNVMGQRATVSGGVAFTDVVVDPELVVPYYLAFEAPQQLGARAQLVHTAIQVGIAGSALQDAHEFVTTRARPFFEAARAGWTERASDDPNTIQRFGRMATRVRAAEALLQQAAAVQEQIGRVPCDAEQAARGSIAVAEAKAFASEIAVDVASDLFSLTGASATDQRYDLDRHWRNARTHASHDPVDWKYHHTGNFLLNGVLPPNHGQL